MAETIDSLLVSLGLETDKKSFDIANAAFKGVTDNMMQLAATVAAGFGFDKLTRDFAGFVSEIDRFSRRHLIDPNNVLRWGYAYEQMGGKVQDAMSTIEKFNNLRDKAADGRIDENALRQAGINPYELINKDNPHSAMMWAAENMPKMNMDQRRRFSNGLGLNKFEQDVFSKGPNWVQEQFNEYNKRGQIITPEAIKIANEYNDAVQKLTTNLNGLASELSGPLTASITNLANRADKWLIDNKQGIIEKLDEAMPLLKTMAIGITAIAASKGVSGIFGKMGGFKSLIRAGITGYAINEVIEKDMWDWDSKDVKENWGIKLPDWLFYKNMSDWFDSKDESIPDKIKHGMKVSSINPNALDIPGNDPLNNMDYIKNYLTMSGVNNSSQREQLAESFSQASKKYNVPVSVLLGMAKQESGFNPNATGPQTKWGQAKGIMQYLDSSAQSLGIDPLNSDQAINAAAMQLRQRLNKGESMEEAVAEHHAGPNRKLWGEKTEDYVRKVGNYSLAMEDYAARRNTIPTPPIKSKSSNNGAPINATVNANVTVNEAGNPEKTKEIVQQCINDACNELAVSVRTTAQ
ncbi:transglycosylase SLT domain-containing protein [Photorhabdus namnaonensis]|uniref:Transglycosylase SLT domain protein n=1 Tax=Photorhabdus namnaonensis TaxID=1851568 RepID=A0A1B8YFY2_9GAMM|nr:transglycosylase SLT domain-containing protein [Photorhabdus namnaonensis]OCA53952.1 Transglycosylase SLT domain protein [Photorhabdus namnaonensis]